MAETELEEAGLDTEGMAESTAKLREEMLALSNVDIMLDENTFKSTYDILDELADKWQNLTDIQQASVTELIAGKRQGNIMSALMTNWDVAEASMKQAENSDGSAERELANYQKGIQYSIDKFKASFQEMSNATFDDELIKGIIDSGTTALNILTQIVDTLGLFPTLLGGVGIATFIKNLDHQKVFKIA